MRNNLSQEGMNTILKSLRDLESFCREKSFSGYDPYDGLNANLLNNRNKYLRLLLSQILVYNPINLRPIINVKKGINPKGLSLAIIAYCRLIQSGIFNYSFFKSNLEKMSNFLLSIRSPNFSQYCWGYNFPWQSSNRYLNKNEPTIVSSSYVGGAFIQLYDITKDKKYLRIAKSVCDFIIDDLNIMKADKKICFSYTCKDEYFVHNANLLGASLLSKVYTRTGEKRYKDYSLSAFDFTISEQSKSGLWYYSFNPNGKHRLQIDWHQGFILESLSDMIKELQPESEIYSASLRRGLSFYKNEQFTSDYEALWRWPRKWPIDIHNQAQGIITFSKLSSFNKDNLDFALKICIRTINTMQDKKGFFYYQKWPFYKNKISYMRWGQTWMLLALSELIYNLISSRSLKLN